MHAGIILAGGRSRRMGRDKALLPLPGAEQLTFVEHLVTLLASVCGELVLVVRDAAQAIDYARYLPSTVQIVTDQVPDMGPLMGLFSGLSAIQSSHALVTAVDTPFLQPALLSFLLALPLDDTLAIPVVDGLPQVLLTVYPRSILPVIEQRLNEGRRDPRSLLELVSVHFIESTQLQTVDPQLRSFMNINTPAELQELL